MVELTLYYGREKKRLYANKGDTVSEILSQNGIILPQPCAGKKHCGKCKVIAKGSLSEPDEYERKALNDNLIKKGYRLACKAKVLADVTVTMNCENKSTLSEGNSVFNASEVYVICADIGTTNIEIAVLQSGEKVRYTKFINPLCIYGADVISRAEKSVNGHRDDMSALLVKSLKKAIDELKIPYDKIEGTVITANTTMLTILTKKDCSGLVKFPFKVASLFGYSIKCDDFGIKRIFLPPCVSAFVGADAVCGALACEMNSQNDKIRLLIDIGTNGEIILNNKGSISATSTAMGCAFEGAELYSGMNAQSGAISRVFIKNGEVKYSVIDNKEAIGLCAGGVVDLLSALSKLNIIDETGRLDKNSEYCVELGSECAFRFKDCFIYLTQKDVRSIQQAKSALCAGIKVLLSIENILPDDVNEVILTGSFGNNINIENAVNIGLLPKEFLKKCRIFPNLALQGAVKLALNDNLKEESVLFAKKVKSVNLSEIGEFSELYAECMYIERI